MDGGLWRTLGADRHEHGRLAQEVGQLHLSSTRRLAVGRLHLKVQRGRLAARLRRVGLDLISKEPVAW